jgi:hypothetical protein
MKRVDVDAERDLDNIGYACLAKAGSLRNARDERGIEPRKKSPHSHPQGACESVSSDRSERVAQSWLDVSPDVVGVPKNGAKPGRFSSACEHRGGAEVWGVSLENVWTEVSDHAADSSEVSEHVIRRVVRKAWSADAD